MFFRLRTQLHLLCIILIACGMHPRMRSSCSWMHIYTSSRNAVSHCLWPAPLHIHLLAQTRHGFCLAKSNHGPNTAGSGSNSAAATAQEDVGAGTSGVATATIIASWLTAEQPGDWPILHWLITWALPQLIAALRMVAPQTETEALRSILPICLNQAITHT